MDFRQAFLKFASDTEALKFGEFTLKSGRVSPYFFNAGSFNTGLHMQQLCHFYAESIISSGIEFDVLFGPAYKGIPLAVGTAMAIASKTGKPTPYAFNRKEAKDHGEGGTIVGSPLTGRVLIIDDVISAGTSIRESFDIIDQNDASAAGIIIALDRQERGKNTDTSAIDEIKSEFKVPVLSIATLGDLIEFSRTTPDFETYLAQIEQYRNEFGSTSI